MQKYFPSYYLPIPDKQLEYFFALLPTSNYSLDQFRNTAPKPRSATFCTYTHAENIALLYHQHPSIFYEYVVANDGKPPLQEYKYPSHDYNDSPTNPIRLEDSTRDNSAHAYNDYAPPNSSHPLPSSHLCKK